MRACRSLGCQPILGGGPVITSRYKWCTVFLQSNVTATTCSSHVMAFDRGNVVLGLSDNCSFVVNVYRVPDEFSLYS